MRKFNASDYMVMQSEKLFKQKGFLSAPVQNPGKTLPTKIARVYRLENSDENRRQVRTRLEKCCHQVSTGDQVF